MISIFASPFQYGVGRGVSGCVCGGGGGGGVYFQQKLIINL